MADEVQAFYYDGKTPRQQAVTLSVSVRGLHLHFLDGRIDTWRHKDFNQILSGMPGEALCLEKGLETIVTHDPRIRDMLYAHTPHAVARYLSQVNSFRALGVLLIGCVLALVASYRVLLPAVGKGLAACVPWRVEHVIGKALVQELVPPGLRSSQTAGTTAIEAVMARLTPAITHGRGHPYVVTLSKSRVVNAYALPGGQLIINQGLLAKLESPEELAGILVHEIQHVERRHVLASVCREAIVGVLIAGLTGQGDHISDIVRAAHGLGSLSMSREAETEADESGFDLLVAAQIDPHAMVRAYSHLDDSGPVFLQFLSTHPNTQQRLSRLRQRARSTRISPKPIALSIPWQTVRQGETLASPH